MAAPFAWIEMITPRNRKAGSRVKNGMLKVESQPRPLVRKPHPGSPRHLVYLVDSKRGGNYTAADYSDQGRPETQHLRAAERKRGDDDQGSQCSQGRRHRLDLRCVVQQTEHNGRQGDGEYHHHRAAHGWRDDSPQNEQPLGDDDLDHSRDENQGREGRRAPVHHRRDAERDGEGGGKHRKNGPAPTGPSRRTCSSVAAPQTSREAKTIHTR